MNRDVDSLLDEALDELENQELQDNVRDISIQADEKKHGDSGDFVGREETAKINLSTLRDHFNVPAYGSTLQSTLKSLSSTQEGNETVENLFSHLATKFDTNLKSTMMPTDPGDEKQIHEADREIAATLQMIGAAQGGMAGVEVGKMEQAGESMMESMMAQYEALAEKEDYNEVPVQ
jgi:hypothetical protein